MVFSICIFEDSYSNQLYPLTLTRPSWELRCGISSLKDKVLRQFSQASTYLFCRDYLAEIVKEQNPRARVNQIDAENCLFINGRVLFESKLLESVETRQERICMCKGEVVAAFLRGANVKKMQLISEKPFQVEWFSNVDIVEIHAEIINYPWDLINKNEKEIEHDFNYLDLGGQIQGEISEHAALLTEQRIYIGQNSKIKPGVVLDAAQGPVYIGNNTTVMPNAVIVGPAFVGDNSTIKIGARIYEGTSIGEVCKVGGEIERSIIHSYSNKQHEGFLGHAYLGQRINLGADTNNSDLKNNFGTVKVYVDGKWVDSGSQFVGLFMGDHSK
ncbi:MAG: putative sugar nucleotidyl transferase, partial [bacterium]